MKAPLAGMRVIDLGQGVAGPYCAMLLADLGADVIKIEPPRGDWGRTMGSQIAPGMGTTYLSVNRGKRSLCLDMRADEGRDIARSLALKADVLVESFRPGVLDRLGLGYTALSAENDDIIYVSISGYGPDGPAAQLPAGDSVMQAYGGFMSINGEAGGPPLRAGNVVSDMLAGLYAAQGVLGAVIVRERGGGGDRVQVSLLDALMAFQSPPLVEYLATGKVPVRSGSAHPLLQPSGTFETSDGAIVLSVLDHQWPAFCKGIGVERLLDDARFADNAGRVAHQAELFRALAPVFAARTTEDCLGSLRGQDVLCAPINDYAALADEPQVLHNGLIRTLAHPLLGPIPGIGTPVRSGGTTAPDRAPPRLGEHGAQVLAEVLNLSATEIESLAASGTLGPADAVAAEGTSK